MLTLYFICHEINKLTTIIIISNYCESAVSQYSSNNHYVTLDDKYIVNIEIIHLFYLSEHIDRNMLTASVVALPLK